MSLNVAILPVAAKDTPIPPLFTPYEFLSRSKFTALLQLVKQWLNFTFSRFHAFCYGRQNKNRALKRIELMTSALVGVQVIY